MSSHRPRFTNPYVGPRAYQVGEQLYGRDSELRELFYLLTAERIVLLHSPSGAGKTSLIQAGLIPRLRGENFHVLPIVRVGSDVSRLRTIVDRQLLASLLTAGASEQRYQPSAPPNRYLFSTLLALDENLPVAQQMPLDRLATMSLEAYLSRRPQAVPPTGTEVLIFDQFEEILTVDPNDRAAKLRFFEEAGAALRDRRRWALFAMREEYVATLEPYLASLPTRLRNTFRLELLSPVAARTAMQEPARAHGVRFTEPAVEQLIGDLRRTVVQLADGSSAFVPGPVIEPVQLQVVCLRVWERKFEGRGGPPSNAAQIGVEDVVGAGEVDQVLADYYTDCVRSAVKATGVPERVLRDWVDQTLITPGGLRGQVLREATQTKGFPNRAVQLLINSHLVRAEERRGAIWVELAHDRLIGPIQAANAAWREANLSTLQRQAALWNHEGRPDGLLLQGRALADAETWAAEHDEELDAVDRAFLATCLKARQVRRSERQQRRRIEQLAWASFVGGFLALALGASSFFYFRQAQQANAELANKESTALAAQATDSARRQIYETTGAILIKNFSDEQATVQVRTFLTQEAQLADAQSTVTAAQSTIDALSAAQQALSLQLDDAQRARATEAVQQAAVVATQVAASLAIEAESYIDSPPDDPGVALREGIRLAEAGTQNNRFFDVLQAVIQRVESQPPFEAVIRPAGPITSATWDNRGVEILVTAGQSIEIWDASTRTQRLAWSVPSGLVTTAAWSSNGAFIATGGDDGTVRIWEARSGDQRVVLQEHQQGVTGLAWSPDDQRMVSTSSTEVILWDITRGMMLRRLRAANERVTRNAWSPDGSRFVTSGTSLRVRNGLFGEEELSEAAQAPFTSAAWSPDGARILTADSRAQVQIWRIEDGLAAPQNIQVDQRLGSFAMWSRTGRFLVVAGSGGNVLTFDSSSGQSINTWSGHSGAVRTVAWSPDGQRVVSSGDDGTVRVFFFYPEDVLRRARELQ